MPVGMVTTYDLTVGTQLQVEDLIYVISPFDTPLQGGMSADGRSALSTFNITQKKYEWLDEELLIPRTTVGTTFATADVVLVVAAGERERFQTGDIIKVGNETIRVTGYDAAANTLNVTRAYAGTAAQHAVGAVLMGVGSALPEGSDPPSPRTRDRVNRFNVTEIFGPYAVQVSGTEDIIRKYGLPMGEFDYQAANRTKEAFVAVEQALLYGQRVEDTTNEWRSMGGFDYFITTNADATTTDLTETKMLDLGTSVFNLGGNPDIFMLSPAQKRKLSALNTAKVQVSRDDRTAGQVVTYYESDFGVWTLLMNRWLRSSDAFLFSRDQAQIGTLRPFVFEMLAKTGDSRKGMIVGEKGFALKRQQHAAKFTTLLP